MNPKAIPERRRGFDHVFFDCDSTLSAIEGIDELARTKGRYREVKALTDAVMNGETPLGDVYDRRLELLMPTHSDITAIADQYRDNAVTDARDVIGALRAAGKGVFVVSGGLLDAVHPFARWLGVPDDHIHAVTVRYEPPADPTGSNHGDGYARSGERRYVSTVPSPLVEVDGKAVVVRDLLQGCSGRSVLIGDGASDLAAEGEVDLFVGFTGVVERALVAANAPVLITGDSLAPVLGVALSSTEEAILADTPYRTLVEESRSRIRSGELTIKRGFTS